MPKTRSQKAPLKVTRLVAEVTITVLRGKFRDILNQGGATEAAMAMRGTHTHVSVKGIPPTIHIKKPGARIRFKIDSENVKETFFPIGIAFWRKRGSPHDRPGQRNFKPSLIRLGKRWLSVTDHFIDTGKGDWYKFSIVIQRKRDGAIGIIDPPIIHEDP